MADKEPFRIYFAGAEVPGWRKLLTNCGVKSQLLTFFHLYKRVKKAKKPWLLEDYFDPSVHLFLDSGGYTARNNEKALSLDEWDQYILDYYKFVELNGDRLTIISEFDGFMFMDEPELAYYRDKYTEMFPEKFLSVWHPFYGMPKLPKMAARYPRIGVTEEALRKHPGIRTRVNALATEHGTKFHGFAITRPDPLVQIRFASVDSTSWISGTKFGDTIWFINGKLHRYPYQYKMQSRKRHYMDFKKAGLDADGILRDETDPVNRMTIYAWQRLEEYVNRRRVNSRAEARKPTEPKVTEEQPKKKIKIKRGTPDPQIAATKEELGDPEIADWQGDEPAIREDEGGNLPATGDEPPFDTEFDDTDDHKPAIARPKSERTVLPIIGFQQVLEHAAKTDDDGKEIEAAKMALVPSTQAESLRACNNCYVSGSCPAFKKDHKCAFNLPLEVRTKDQMFALLRAVIEMQGQRVLFGKFVEDLEGGYADQNLSNEVDRLFNMVKSMKDIADNRDFVKLTVESKGQSGILSRIFGEKVGDQARQLGDDQQLGQEDIDQFTHHLLNSDGDILDAEVIE